MVLLHIFFNIVVHVFHTRECYNKTQVLKSTDISGTSHQMHVHQSTHMCFVFSKIRVLLLWISHVCLATQYILISLSWTTYHHLEVSIVQYSSGGHKEVPQDAKTFEVHCTLQLKSILYQWRCHHSHNQILLYYTSHFPPHHTYAWKKLLNPCPYITVQLDHITHVIPIFNQWYLWIQHPKAHNTTRQCGLSFILSSNHWHETTSVASTEIRYLLMWLLYYIRGNRAPLI